MNVRAMLTGLLISAFATNAAAEVSLEYVEPIRFEGVDIGVSAAETMIAFDAEFSCTSNEKIYIYFGNSSKGVRIRGVGDVRIASAPGGNHLREFSARELSCESGETKTVTFYATLHGLRDYSETPDEITSWTGSVPMDYFYYLTF